MIESLLSTLSSFVLYTIDTLGYGGIFILMALESANIPIPSEVIMPFSGFLVASGRFELWAVILVGALGNLFGSLVNYWIAYRFGERAILFFSKMFLFGKRDVVRAEKWFRKIGLWAAFVTRLLPVVRTFISFPLGMARVSLWKFSALTFIGSFLWSGALAYTGVVLGNNWKALEPYYHKFSAVIVLILVVMAGVWVYHHKKGISASKVLSEESIEQ